MACRECHFAKEKCEKTSIPCARCARLSLKCVPHQSKQGRGKKPRKKEKSSTHYLAEDSIAENTCQLGSKHYGLHFVIRHWIAYAISRRSFSLLAKASALASKCAISMDQVLCGENDFDAAVVSMDGNRMMTFLPSMILKPGREQHVGADPLALSEVPDNLLEAIDYCRPGSLQHPGTRLIVIREVKCGLSRYYLSAAMQRDVVSWQRVQDTWKANLMEVKDLWLPKEEKQKYNRGLVEQIALHQNPYTRPKPGRTSSTKIFLASKKVIDVECKQCLTIANLDHAFFSIEYIPAAGEKKVHSDSEQSGDNLLASLMDNADDLESASELDWLLQTLDDEAVNFLR